MTYNDVDDAEDDVVDSDEEQGEDLHAYDEKDDVFPPTMKIMMMMEIQQ